MRKTVFTAIGCVALIISAVSAQEPQRLPAPEAKALEDRSVIVHNGTGEEVQGDEVPGEHYGNQAYGNQAYGNYPHGDAEFGGYPYNRQWHAGYQHPLWGRPLALVVPPNSHYQTIYSWGVATTQITPIYPQYNGPAYGAGADFAGPYRYPPYWPSDTRQFGVYYIRGPWEAGDPYSQQVPGHGRGYGGGYGGSIHGPHAQTYVPHTAELGHDDWQTVQPGHE